MSMQESGRGADQAASPPPPMGSDRPGVGTTGSTAGGATPRLPEMPQGGTSPMRQQGGQGASSAKEQVGQAVDEIASRAAPVVEQTQEKAGQALDQAREQATTLLEVQKERAVDGLDAVVHAAHRTSQQLRVDGQETVAHYADQAAQRAERLAGYLREHEVGDLVDELEDFARRQPQLFLAGGLALGLIAARFFEELRSLPQRTAERWRGRWHEAVHTAAISAPPAARPIWAANTGRRPRPRPLRTRTRSLEHPWRGAG